MADINQQPAPLGFGGTNPAQNAPVPDNGFAASNERLAREKKATAGDYAGSIWRQDGLVDGFVADLAGREMMPDANFNPFTDPNVKEMQKRLWPEYQNELYKAHSAAHAGYIQDRLLQKQEDQVRLGDMGWKGNVGRFALNAVMPDQLLAGMVGGGLTRLAQVAKMGKAASVGVGVASGAAQNVGYEALRQSVSYENDHEKLLEAGLMGAAITFPFALREANVAAKAAAAAALEHDALLAAKAAEQGAELTAGQKKAMADAKAAHEAIKEFDQGTIDQATFESRTDALFPTDHVVFQADHPEGLPAAANDPTGGDRVSGPRALPGPEAEKPVVHDEESLLPQPEPVHAPVEVPPTVAADPAAPAPEAPAAHPAEQYVGQEVSWAGPEGDTLEGTVQFYNPKIGKLIVKTVEGMKAVRHDQLDQHYPDEAPSGFLHGSVGAAQVERVGKIAEQPTFMARTGEVKGKSLPTRFDLYAMLNSSPVMKVRELAYRLIKDPIQNDKFEAQGMTASEWKKQLQRVHGGEFHRVADEAYDEAVKAGQVSIWGRDRFKRDFYSMVSRVTRGDASVLAENPAIAASLTKASGAQKKFYASMLEEMKAAGVKGAEHIDPNEYMVNRVWHHGHIREMEAKHGGKAALHEVIASAIQDKAGVLERMRKAPGNAGLTDAQLLTKKAASFLRTIKALEHSPALREIQLAGRDMGTLRRELADMDVKPHQIDDLVDLLFEVRPQDADAGRAANLKFRFALDEKAKVTTSAGELHLSDLWENDARVLADVYGQSMAGHVGLAKHGIDSQAAWARELKAVTEETEAQGHNGSRVKQDMEWLQKAYNNIVGRPMSEDNFSGTARAAAAFRGYVRGVMLPQLGVAAAMEMSKAIAQFGFRTMLKQMPSLRGLLVAVRKGYIPDEGLARQMMVIAGFGQEKVAAYHRAQEIADGYFGEQLSAMEHGANRVSHAVDVMSGNASFTSLTKQLSSMMAVQQLHEYASGLRTLSAKMKERWVGQGISHDDIEPVMEALKEHSTAENGVVKEIRYEDWKKASPKTYETFQTFIQRQVRDAIQDHDLGETMPFMHSVLGKVFAELKTFFLVAHAKNFLKNAYYRDATTLQVFAFGFLGEALGYMTQSAANYPGQLDKKLQPDVIAKAALFRMPMLGTLSFLADSGYSLATGGESLVQPGMTTNTDNRSIFNTPSLMVAKKIGSGIQTLGGFANPNAVTTSSEAKDLLGALPGARLLGLHALGQYWANTFPKSDPNHRMAPGH